MDRVKTVFIPFRYQAILTKKRRPTCIAVLWILRLVIGIASYLINAIVTSEPFIGTRNQSVSTS